MEPEIRHSRVFKQHLKQCTKNSRERRRTRRQPVIYDEPKFRLTGRSFRKHSSSVHHFDDRDSFYDPWMTHNDRTRIEFDPTTTESFSTSTSRNTLFSPVGRYLLSFAFYSFLQRDTLHHTLLHQIRKWASSKSGRALPSTSSPKNDTRPRIVFLGKPSEFQKHLLCVPVAKCHTSLNRRVQGRTVEQRMTLRTLNA